MIRENNEFGSGGEFPWEKSMTFRNFAKTLGFCVATGAIIENAEAAQSAVYVIKQGFTAADVARQHNQRYGTGHNAHSICGLARVTYGEGMNPQRSIRVSVPVPAGQSAPRTPRATPIQNRPQTTPAPETPPESEKTPEPERPEVRQSIEYPRHWNREVIGLIDIEHNGRAEDDGGLDRYLQSRFRDPEGHIMDRSRSNQISLKPLPQPNNSANYFVPNRALLARTPNWETYICMKLQPISSNPDNQQTSYGYVGYKHPTRGLVLTHSFYVGHGKRGSETGEYALHAGDDGRTVEFEDQNYGANYWSVHAQRKANEGLLSSLNRRYNWNLSYELFSRIGECSSFAQAQRVSRGISQATYNAIRQNYIPIVPVGQPVPNDSPWGYMINGRVQIYKGVFWHGTQAQWTAGLPRSRMCIRSREKDFALMPLAFGFRRGSAIDIQHAR